MSEFLEKQKSKLELISYKIKTVRYKGVPVFGQKSNPLNTSEFLALAGTVVFWFFVFLFLIFANPLGKKKTYKTVQITLASTPEKKAESAASAASAGAAAKSDAVKTEEVASASAAKENQIEPQKPAKAAEVKTAESAKTEKAAATVKDSAAASKSSAANAKNAASKPVSQTPAAKAPAEPVTYAKSVDDLLAEQENQTSKKAVWDDSLFGDDDSSSETTSSSASTSQKVTSQSSIGGSAATAASASQTQDLQSRSMSASSSKGTASAQTTAALSGIKSAAFTGSAGSSASTQVSAYKSSGDGKSSLQMSNGRMRALIDPAEPVINISEENAKLIDRTTEVTISFTVVESGNVQFTSIGISPASVLPLPVQNEIKNQLAKWRFEAADYSATASFKYTIIKK